MLMEKLEKRIYSGQSAANGIIKNQSTYAHLPAQQ
jgi:hypothetical protein